MIKRAMAIGVLAAAALVSAAFAGPEQPPAPWFVVADIPSHDPAFKSARWLLNREARTLRYCRKAAEGPDFACAPDVVLPDGRWVIQRLQDVPSPGVASAIRFYSPDLDRNLVCRAASDGAVACE
jgi:hypothetical protein